MSAISLSRWSRWGFALLATLLLTPAGVRAAEPPAARRFAVLVGVKDYEHRNLLPLQYTENDVAELGSVLRAAGFEVVLLTSSDGARDKDIKPTRANIERHLKAALDKAGKGDLVLVGLAGHGLGFERIEDSFFCPQDAVPLDDADSRKTLLSLKGVYQQMEASKAGLKLLIVDACRNDPKARGARSLDAGALRPPQGVAALFSCSTGERAWEHDNYRHGIFFYHLLEGLRGKAKNSQGDVTWDLLQSYVREAVPEDAQRLYATRQTPSLNAGELRGRPPVLVPRSVPLQCRATLAVLILALDRAMAERWKLPQQCQPQVAYVVPGGGADRIGLRAGDVLVRINGRDVAAFYQRVDPFEENKLSERLEIELLRDGERLKLIGRFETYLSEDQVVRRVREAAEEGSAAAQTYFGAMNAYGSDVAQKEEGVRWLRKAADQGYASAQQFLGDLYATGRRVEKDEAEAARWYRKAADQGVAESQFDLGIMYEYGRGLAKDEAEASRWYRKAAIQGYAEAQHNLGWMYDRGHGVAKDEAEAVKWYRKAADQRLAMAQGNLGAMYGAGRGVAQDHAEALKWFRKAADQGNDVGQAGLGLMYANGYGVTKDYAEAVKWYRKAAEQGHKAAQVELGSMFYYGRGVTKDFAEAVKWYRKAADQGDTYGQYNLGWMYAAGHGVAQDLVEARKWYAKAAVQGHRGAQAALAKLNQN